MVWTQYMRRMVENSSIHSSEDGGAVKEQGLAPLCPCACFPLRSMTLPILFSSSSIIFQWCPQTQTPAEVLAIIDVKKVTLMSYR